MLVRQVDQYPVRQILMAAGVLAAATFLALHFPSRDVALTPAVFAQGRVVSEILHSQALRGNLIGDTPDRTITIYLPPGHGRDAPRRYPVVYLAADSALDSPRDDLTARDRRRHEVSRRFFHGRC